MTPDEPLLALLAHELKNRAAALEGGLAAEGASPALRRQAAGLRERLVALTLLMAGLAPRDLCTETCSAAEIWHEIRAGLMSPAFPVELDCEDPPLFACDPRRLVPALEAGLDNALRHARTQVRVSVQAWDGGVRWCIDDDGPGPGVPGPASTGLGLRLARAVAGAHVRHGRAGRAGLEANPQGGARFVLWLP